MLKIDPAERISAELALAELMKPPAIAPPPSPVPAPDSVYPGPLQDLWNPFYNGVKNYSAFEDAIKMLEANPASKNNRSVSQPPAST
jgi:hypothetical protein